MEVVSIEQQSEMVVSYTGRGSLSTLDHENIEIVNVPRMKEENLLEQVYNIDKRYNDKFLTSPTLLNSPDGCTCCETSDHIPNTTGQKRGRPVKDITKWRPVKKAFTKKEWSDEEVSLLIDLWRNEDILYNSKSEFHSNKEERMKAVERIMYDLQESNIDVCTEQVSEKMTSLRCYYSGQIGKERGSKIKGTDAASIFVSPWKFMKNMSFLQSNYKPRNTELSAKYNGGNIIHNNTHSKTNNKHNNKNNIQDGTNNIHNGRNNIQDGTNNIHNGKNKIQDGINNIHNGRNKIQDSINNIHNSRNKIQDGTNNIHNDRNKIQDGTNNIHSDRNKIQDGTNNIHNGRNKIQDGTTNIQNAEDNIHNGVNGIHNGTHDINISNSNYNGANDNHMVDSSIHNGVNNSHIRKDKENQRNMMMNALKQTGKIMEVALERFSKETSKTSDESFGDLVVSLLKEIKNPEKKDMVKLEIHNLLVKAKYDT